MRAPLSVLLLLGLCLCHVSLAASVGRAGAELQVRQSPSPPPSPPDSPGGDPTSGSSNDPGPGPGTGNDTTDPLAMMRLCSAQCTSEALPKAKCSPSDAACICNSKKFLDAVQLCLQTRCSTDPRYKAVGAVCQANINSPAIGSGGGGANPDPNDPHKPSIDPMPIPGANSTIPKEPIWGTNPGASGSGSGGAGAGTGTGTDPSAGSSAGAGNGSGSGSAGAGPTTGTSGSATSAPLKSGAFSAPPAMSAMLSLLVGAAVGVVAM